MPRHRSAKPATQKGLRPLSRREENFIREFLIDLNGAKAAQRAGYAPRGARVTASRLLSKPSVITALQQQREKHARRLEVTTERVLDELAICGFSDIGEFWPTSPGERLDIAKMDRGKRAAIQLLKIKETIITGEDGQPNLLERTTELKLYNKVHALEKLALHLGLFERGEKDSLVDRVRKMTPEQRVARMEEIMRIARERYGHLIEQEERQDDGG